MVLRVRADVPLVWRNPNSLQFGVDRPLVVLDDVSAGIERMISALVGGISRSGYDMMARSVGVDADSADELLSRLAPVLDAPLEAAPAAEPDAPIEVSPEAAPTAAPAPEERPRVVVSGDGPLADELRGMLEAEGVLAASDESAPDLGVVVADWVIAPEDHGSWLRRDIPHLPVVAADGGVTVGPLVEPGAGPCLYCVQLTRTDDDPAWPAIATQLWNRQAPGMSRLAIAEAAAFAARHVLDRVRPGWAVSTGSTTEAPSWHLAAGSGAVSSRAWTRHAACRCAAPEESDWAPAADLANRSATTREAAVAVPA